MERCDECKFARAYPQPSGEKPEYHPQPPLKWWEILGGSSLAIHHVMHDWRNINYYAWTSAKHRADNLVRCHRFPEAHDKNKAHFCGEYQPHLGGDDGTV